jgi:hypothetical protein
VNERLERWTGSGGTRSADWRPDPRAEREFAGFATETQGARGVTAREIQRRGGEFGQLGAELRQRREHHSEAVLRVLASWQRARLTQSRPVVTEEAGNGAGRN